MITQAQIPGGEPVIPSETLETIVPTSPELAAGRLRHLAKIALAANSSRLNLPHMSASYDALFEVMYRLASELEEELGGA